MFLNQWLTGLIAAILAALAIWFFPLMTAMNHSQYWWAYAVGVGVGTAGLCYVPIYQITRLLLFAVALVWLIVCFGWSSAPAILLLVIALGAVALLARPSYRQ